MLTALLIDARRCAGAACLAAMLGASVPCASQPADAPADPRRVFDGAAPAWLAAVGRLQVPGQRHSNGRSRHYREDCSATLLGGTALRPARTIVTAWHCLENHRDLSRAIAFSITAADGTRIVREAYRLADGGSMRADWAILGLRRPIDAREVAALRPHPGRARPDWPITMAGYSRDTGIGAGGRHLSFHPDCRITRQHRAYTEADCIAHKGASGGAIGQSSGEAIWFSGVVSAGDGVGYTRYIPVSMFRPVLERHLRR